MSLMNKKWPSHFAYHGHPVPGLIRSHHHLSSKPKILIWKAESWPAHWPMLTRVLSSIYLRPWAYPCTFQEAVRERPYEIPPNCRILAFL